MFTLHQYGHIYVMLSNESCKAVFLQTLVGLMAYAYGVSDMGLDILNMLGVTCSIVQIRKHGTILV